MTTPEVGKRAEEYLARKNLVYDSCLGAGTQGSVFVFNIPSQNPERLDQVAVKRILVQFETFGVYIADVNPGNIKFR